MKNVEAGSVRKIAVIAASIEESTNGEKNTTHAAKYLLISGTIGRGNGGWPIPLPLVS
jgi:hypothetical protein